MRKKQTVMQEIEVNQHTERISMMKKKKKDCQNTYNFVPTPQWEKNNYHLHGHI